jgi:hypothetical protein
VSVDRARTSSAGVPSNTTRPPSWPAPGPEVDDPVGVGHHRLVVLDHDHRLAGVDQPVQEAEQLLEVGQVQAGGGLVEHVDAARRRPSGGELEALALAARQRGERLAEAEVAEADVGHALQDGVCAAGCGPRRRRRSASASATGRSSTSAMFLPAEPVLQHRGLEPLALAVLAGW